MASIVVQIANINAGLFDLSVSACYIACNDSAAITGWRSIAAAKAHFAQLYADAKDEMTAAELISAARYTTTYYGALRLRICKIEERLLDRMIALPFNVERIVMDSPPFATFTGIPLLKSTTLAYSAWDLGITTRFDPLSIAWGRLDDDAADILRTAEYNRALTV